MVRGFVFNDEFAYFLPNYSNTVATVCIQWPTPIYPLRVVKKQRLCRARCTDRSKYRFSSGPTLLVQHFYSHLRGPPLTYFDF